MPSSTQQANPFGVFANELSAKTGLDVSVIDAWARAENGVNNNILGITNNGVLASYPNQTVAADATAARLKSLPMYSGILASTGGSASQQALAIARSPWHLGPSGLAKAGGQDPYYTRIFTAAGLLNGTGGLTASSVPITQLPGAVAGAVGSGLSTVAIAAIVVVAAVMFVLLGGLVMLKGNG